MFSDTGIVDSIFSHLFLSWDKPFPSLISKNQQETSFPTTTPPGRGVYKERDNETKRLGGAIGGLIRERHTQNNVTRHSKQTSKTMYSQKLPLVSANTLTEHFICSFN